MVGGIICALNLLLELQKRLDQSDQVGLLDVAECLRKNETLSLQKACEAVELDARAPAQILGGTRPEDATSTPVWQRETEVVLNADGVLLRLGDGVRGHVEGRGAGRSGSARLQVLAQCKKRCCLCFCVFCVCGWSVQVVERQLSRAEEMMAGGTGGSAPRAIERVASVI